MVQAVVETVVQVRGVSVLESRHLLHTPVSFHFPQEEELQARVFFGSGGDGGGGVAGGRGQLREKEREDEPKNDHTYACNVEYNLALSMVWH